jgi:hypothetical protein
MVEFAPLVGGLAGVAAVLVAMLVVSQRLLLDRSGFAELRNEMTELRVKVEALERMVDRERGLKHDALRDVAVARGVITVVERLSSKCSCGALDAIGDLLGDVTVRLDPR